MTPKPHPATQNWQGQVKQLPGIAASNVEVERTDVRATTLHDLFAFDNEFKTKIDFTKQTANAGELLGLEVLLLDEVQQGRRAWSEQPVQKARCVRRPTRFTFPASQICIVNCLALCWCVLLKTRRLYL